MAVIREKPPSSLLDLPSPWVGDLPDPATFPRQASSRLRWYFQHKHSGGGNTLADPIDLELSTIAMIQCVEGDKDVDDPPQTGVGVIQEVCREIFSCSHPRHLAVRPDGRVVFLKIAPCSW